MKTIQDLYDHIVSECSPVDREARFREMLDECYSFESVGGPFASMSPSTVLERCDPVAFRCGVYDYSDSECWIEVNGEEYDGDDVRSARDSFVAELEDESNELQEEVEELESDEDPDMDEIARLNGEISALAAFIRECENAF